LIHNLGPVCLYECTKCKERYTGAENDKATKKWRHNHNKNHWIDNKGRPEWEDE
jgi:hypothetical protein